MNLCSLEDMLQEMYSIRSKGMHIIHLFSKELAVSRVVVVHACIPSTWEVEADGSL